MKTIILGNMISLLGASLMVAIGFIKSKDKVLKAQCIQFGIMGVGNLVLGGVTGFIANIVSIIRNIVCLKTEFIVPLKIVFILAQVVISVKVNTMGVIGWFPVIAACVFTWFLDTKSDTQLKLVIILTEVLWVIYDITLYNYASLIFDLLTIASNTVGIFALRKSLQE